MGVVLIIGTESSPLMTRKMILFAAAVATTLASTAPVLAQPDSMTEPTQRIVRYDDLDLTNARGRERLNTRVRMAVNSACGYASAQSLTERKLVDTCRKKALKSSEPEIAEALRKAAARYAARAD